MRKRLQKKLAQTLLLLIVSWNFIIAQGVHIVSDLTPGMESTFQAEETAEDEGVVKILGNRIFTANSYSPPNKLWLTDANTLSTTKLFETTWLYYDSFTELITNINWLETTAKWIDDGLELTSTATKVTIKKAGVEVGEISGDLLKVKYSGLGGNVVCHPTKTTTVIGRWPDGTEKIWNSGLAKQGNNPAGVNVLGNVDLSPPPPQVWAKQNKPWLDQAIQRNDVIRAVAEPLNIDNVFFNSNNIPTNVFSSQESLKNYLTSLSESSAEVSQLGYYGREIRHLFQNGYSFDPILKVFSK
jgi:hypothetical protein